MSLKQVGMVTPLGAFYTPKGYMRAVAVHGEVALDCSMMSKERKSAVITALKRGYSRGNSQSEQYLMYAAVSEKFGLKHSKVSNGRSNWLALPDTEKVNEFRERVLDVVEPMFQLTGEKFNRKQATAAGWSQWDVRSIRGQPSLMFEKPIKVPMSVLGKGLADILGEPPFGPMCEAINFVKSGGKIVYKF